MPPRRQQSGGRFPEFDVAARMLAAGFAAPVWPALPSGASAFWKLGEASGDAVDSTSNALTLVETAGSVGQADGLLGKARSFPALGYFKIGQVLVASGAFTFACWVNPVDAATYVFMSQGTTSGIRLNMTATTTVFGTSSGANSISVNVQPPAATWTHIAGSVSGTSLKLYINGVLVAAGTKSVNYAGSTFAVGAISNTGASPFSGLIQNAGVWPSALSDGGVSVNDPVTVSSDIGVLYNGGLGHTYP